MADVGVLCAQPARANAASTRSRRTPDIVTTLWVQGSWFNVQGSSDLRTMFAPFPTQSRREDPRRCAYTPGRHVGTVAGVTLPAHASSPRAAQQKEIVMAKNGS